MVPTTAAGFMLGSLRHLGSNSRKHAWHDHKHSFTMKSSLRTHSPAAAHAAHSSRLSWHPSDWHSKQLALQFAFINVGFFVHSSAAAQKVQCESLSTQSAITAVWAWRTSARPGPLAVAVAAMPVGPSQRLHDRRHEALIKVGFLLHSPASAHPTQELCWSKHGSAPALLPPPSCNGSARLTTAVVELARTGHILQVHAPQGRSSPVCAG